MSLSFAGLWIPIVSQRKTAAPKGGGLGAEGTV